MIYFLHNREWFLDRYNNKSKIAFCFLVYTALWSELLNEAVKLYFLIIYTFRGVKIEEGILAGGEPIDQELCVLLPSYPGVLHRRWKRAVFSSDTSRCRSNDAGTMEFASHLSISCG